MSIDPNDGTCWPKVGFASGECYCGLHGRACGWPCAAGNVATRLRAAATAAREALATYSEPADLDVAAAWDLAVDALIDLADVLETPHDPVARAISRALTEMPDADAEAGRG